MTMTKGSSKHERKAAALSANFVSFVGNRKKPATIAHKADDFLLQLNLALCIRVRSWMRSRRGILELAAIRSESKKKLVRDRHCVCGFSALIWLLAHEDCNFELKCEASSHAWYWNRNKKNWHDVNAKIKRTLKKIANIANNCLILNAPFNLMTAKWEQF